MFVWRQSTPPPQKKNLLNTLIQLILLHFWVLNVAFISFHTRLILLLTVGHLVCSEVLKLFIEQGDSKTEAGAQDKPYRSKSEAGEY